LLDTCTSLETLRSNIITEQEKTWQLKSRALWIVLGDQKIKYFQNFSITGRTGIPSGIFRTPIVQRYEVSRISQCWELHTSRPCLKSQIMKNITKYSLYFPKVDEGLHHRFLGIFNFSIAELRDGFKYLGFIFKPKNYTSSYWKWLLLWIVKKMSV